MSHVDWSELHVQLQPLARQLYEQMARREWVDAERTANELYHLTHELHRYCIRKTAVAGKPFTPGYLYEGA